MKRATRAMFAGAASILLAGTPAWAQSLDTGEHQPAANPSVDPRGGQSDASSTDDVPDIVVTAQKRSESAQSIPLAISAIASATLEQTGSRRFEDLAALAPSVSFGTYGAAEALPSIRGVVSGGGFNATTGFYVDEIPFAATFTAGGTELGFFDVNHIEVLRGPQGTLYGAGAMGGAVRILTNDPQLDRFGGRLALTGGAINGGAAEFDATGVLNVPLVEGKLGLRVAGAFTDQGAYIFDPVHGRADGGDIRKRDMRAKLKWQPGDRFTATLTGLYGKTSSRNQATIDLTPAGAPQYGDLRQVTYVPEPSESTTRAANLLLSYEMPWATIVSSSSYVDERTKIILDDTLSLGVAIPRALGLPPEIYQFSGGGGQPLNPSTTYVEELRLVSASSHPLKWVAGAYFQKDDLGVIRIDRFMPDQPLSALTPLAYHQTTNRTFYAVFGEATYDLDSQWHLTAGARYTRVPNTLFTSVYGLAFGAAHSTPATAVSATGSKTSSDFSPKFEITFTPSKDVLLYAEAARGFRPGSANVVLPPTVATIPPTQRPDHLWDYEIGAKTQWFGGRLIANGSLYYIDWKDIQVLTTTAATATTISFPYLGNGGAARVKGAELELRAVPTRALSIALSGSYIDATFSKDSPSIGVTKGTRIAYVPRWTGSASVDYRQPLSDTTTFFAHADLRYSAASTIGYTPAAQGVMTAPYALLGANIGFDLPSDIEMSLFVHNLTDNRAQLAITATALCPDISSCATVTPNSAAQLKTLITQPRTIGITVSKKF